MESLVTVDTGPTSRAFIFFHYLHFIAVFGQ